jgi:L-lactate dehydrogenase complex protein LldF
LEAAGELTDASSLCGACGEVCPVRILIPRLLNRLRFEGVRTVAGSLVRGQGSRRKVTQAFVWRMWAWFNASPGNYRLLSGVLGRVRLLAPKRFSAWTRTREVPRLAPKSLHRMAQEEGFDRE